MPHIKENTAITIEIDPGHGVPLTLVERAVGRKESDEEVDELWCVFDVEAPKTHPNLAKAVRLAAAHGIPGRQPFVVDAHAAGLDRERRTT